jgi:hypothetical protein
LGFFRFTLLLEVSSLLSGLNDCHFAMGLKQLSGIVMDVDLTHPHDGVLLSLENKLTHVFDIGAAALNFTGRTLQSLPRLASSFAGMIVAVARLLGKVLSSVICLPLYRNADFLIISIWASSWKNGVCVQLGRIIWRCFCGIEH